ncbi:hypothetical protein G7046_g2221 [Stylonectria norvegica]|nr:hypothetical protein G7046_g2221 [Stylonectria norvegica]
MSNSFARVEQRNEQPQPDPMEAVPPEPAPPQLARPTLLDEMIADTHDPNKIVTTAPREHFRLNYLDVACLTINRTIGTGIFNSPQTVMDGTGGTGISLIFWSIGILYALSGAHVCMEYGLNVPRYVIDGVEQSVPRSGGDLHYLQYVYPRPRYSENTVVLMGCLFGITFVCIGNMAGNSINCALSLLKAARPEEDFSPGTIRGIAIAIVTFACFIHAFSRRGGILLNNLLALIKVGMMLVIVGTACAVAAGGIYHRDSTKVPDVIGNNTNTANAFKSSDGDSKGANGYATAFLSIIFAFSGLDQPNYVLGEIKRPRKTFPIASFLGVGTVSLLYMVVNICYMVVVAADLMATSSVAEQFFDKPFGALGNERTGTMVFNSFLAISSFGNIVVMTYTAARLKQEIAKQGFLPFPKFFAQNTDVSLGRLLQWLEDRGCKIPYFSPEQHREKTPVGALVLHFFSCLVLIMATYYASSKDAYNILSGIIAYLPTAWFGFFLALGILILRFRGPPETKSVVTPFHPGLHNQHAITKSWEEMSRHTVYPWLSIMSAVVFLLGNAYPVITAWVKPSSHVTQQSKNGWYVVPVVSWSLLLFAGL